MFIDISGRKFGKWIVIRRTDHKKVVRYICICECGTQREVLSASLRSGKSISCGCYQNEIREKHVNIRKVHKSTFNSWVGMRQRCKYKNHNEYHRYGGRGINYDPSWDDFEKFLSDMGAKPVGSSLDRIDNDKDYCKDNCKWSTREEQSSNTSRSIFVQWDGEKTTLKRLSKKIGVKYDRLHNLFRTRGFSLEESVRRASSSS